MTELTETITLSKREYELLIRAKQYVIYMASMGGDVISRSPNTTVISPAKDLVAFFG